MKNGAEFPFVIAFNRDETVTRQAEPMSFQTVRGMPNIICGIDKQTGTSWFAFNKKTGDFACLTNYRTIRDISHPGKKSRGTLVLEYVKMRDDNIPKADKITWD